MDFTKMGKEKLMLGTAQRYLYMSYLETEFKKGLTKIEIEKNYKK